MIRVAIAGTPEGAANFIAALNALGAEGKDVLQETDFSGYDALILPSPVWRGSQRQPEN